MAPWPTAGTEPDQSLPIGDTAFDVETARGAGVRAVGVAWGYHRVADLEAAGATGVITASMSGCRP